MLTQGGDEESTCSFFVADEISCSNTIRKQPSPSWFRCLKIHDQPRSWAKWQPDSLLSIYEHTTWSFTMSHNNFHESMICTSWSTAVCRTQSWPLELFVAFVSLCVYVYIRQYPTKFHHVRPSSLSSQHNHEPPDTIRVPIMREDTLDVAWCMQELRQQSPRHPLRIWIATTFFVCRTCSTQYDGTSFHCLLCWLPGTL